MNVRRICRVNILIVQTPPVTPREGTRRLIARTGESCLEVLTPAKTDDFSRPSSIRLPKQGFRSPVTAFKQPIIRLDEGTLSPPHLKKRKSSSTSPKQALPVKDAFDVKRDSDVDFSTPPHRSVSLETLGAPRKPRRVLTTDDEPSCNLFDPVRALDFGGCDDVNTSSIVSDQVQQIDWDSLIRQPRVKSEDITLFRRMMSAIALSGLDIGGVCRLSELKAVLSTGFTQEETKRCLNMLHDFDNCISFTEHGDSVKFLPSFAPAEILRTFLTRGP